MTHLCVFWILFHLLPFWFQIFCFELQHDQMWWEEIRSCKGLRLPTECIADIFVTLMLKWIRYFHLQMHAYCFTIVNYLFGFQFFFLNFWMMWSSEWSKHECEKWFLKCGENVKIDTSAWRAVVKKMDLLEMMMDWSCHSCS